MTEPEIWTADPRWRRRVVYVGLGAGFAALAAVAVCCTVLWQTDNIPWVR